MYNIDNIDIHINGNKTNVGLKSIHAYNNFDYIEGIFKEADKLLRLCYEQLDTELLNCVAVTVKVSGKKYKFVYNVATLSGNRLEYSHYDKEENLRVLEEMKLYYNTLKKVNRLELLMEE